MAGEVSITAGALAKALDERFPVAWAEPWDRVGLISGDPEARITSVLVTLDATAEAVTRARALGAAALVTHHPPYLEAPDEVAAGSGPRGTVEAALRLGVPVISMHTNLDRSPEGATALPGVLGFDVLTPLETGAEEVAMVVTYAPPTAAEALTAAMTAAGAGRLGPYEGCSFVSDGFGRFSPRTDAHPVIADSGAGVDEVRIEMVCPRHAAATVLEAARDAHPYEEPVVLCMQGLRARGTARLGRICSWTGGSTLDDLASHVARSLAVPVKVWGEGRRSVGRIAVANGSAGSLVPAAIGAADVLVAGEVRYHDALDATSAGLALVEAGHDATERPLLDVLVEAVRASVPAGVCVVLDDWNQRWRMVESTHDRG